MRLSNPTRGKRSIEKTQTPDAGRAFSQKLPRRRSEEITERGLVAAEGRGTALLLRLPGTFGSLTPAAPPQERKV